MVTIDINNSFSQINSLPVFHFKALRQLMSYSVDAQVAYFASNFNRTRYLLDKYGAFPTGLLYIVEKYVADNHLKVEFIDLRKRPVSLQEPLPFNMTHPPYQEQVNAATAAIDAHRGIISAPTGSGKSVMIALTIWALQVRTLVVVPTLELKRQLTETFSAIFGAPQVGTIRQNRRIAVENVDSLTIDEVCMYDCVIIDEFHHSAAATYRKLNKKAWKNVYYRFGFTATPFRSRDEERLLLESILSKVIYQLSFKTAVDKGFIVPIKAYYVDVPAIPVKGNNWASVYKEAVVENTKLHEMTIHLMHIHRYRAPTLCLVKEIDHGKYLSLKGQVLFVHGSSEDRSIIQDFSNGQLAALIGTSGVMGEGIDTKAASIVILAGGGKSKNAFMQQVGRVVRRWPGKEYGTVIIFKNNAHKYLLRHFNTCVKFLKEEYGVKPERLFL